jgi:hypothetical protein
MALKRALIFPGYGNIAAGQVEKNDYMSRIISGHYRTRMGYEKRRVYQGRDGGMAGAG